VQLLLDTHALLWWLAGTGLTADSVAVIASRDNDVFVSAASTWEIAIKRKLGKLIAPDDLEDQILASGFAPLVIELDDGVRAGGLPRHHEDPFDRMLIAQAMRRGLTVVTRDTRFAQYSVAMLLA